MTEVKNDIYYLMKVIKDIDHILKHTKNITCNELELNEVLLDSVVFRLIQISENIDNVSFIYKEKHPSIPWKDIKGFRNRLVHDYGNVNLKFIYDTIKMDLPSLRKIIEDDINK
ncbi:MAG: DUF86 domain-containing protein [Anaeroplasmataceae bacterium]|nr:DUF86 domain-containing protein [Anaeroplasmataceae bacterium]